MNNNRRKRLKQASELLNQALSIVTEAKEEDSLDNLPENLQGGDRYSAMEKAVDELEEAIDNIESATENIDNAC